MLVEDKTAWPENSQQFWNTRKKKNMYRRALVFEERAKNTVVVYVVGQLMPKFRLIVQQTYGLWRVGWFSFVDLIFFYQFISRFFFSFNLCLNI